MEAAMTESVAKRWYIVQTYAGFENKAKKSLEERITLHKMADKFEQVFVPIENVVETVRGERKTTTRKLYPNYMFVKMEMNKETWHLVKNTPKIMGFVGDDQANPPPRQLIRQAPPKRGPPLNRKVHRLSDVDEVRHLDLQEEVSSACSCSRIGHKPEEHTQLQLLLIYKVRVDCAS